MSDVGFERKIIILGAQASPEFAVVLSMAVPFETIVSNAWGRRSAVELKDWYNSRADETYDRVTMTNDRDGA